MNDNGLRFLQIGEGTERRAIAVRAQEGAPPGLFWLGGYKSDMKGTKAQALADWAARQRRACVRFDYSGHGESEGAFTDGTIGRWLAESLSVFDANSRGPQILIGSSMGGWIALLLVRALQRRRALA
ncbi:MAG: alpha/beta hydrolase, partial [Xanthobacteraceae bacterium]